MALSCLGWLVVITALNLGEDLKSYTVQILDIFHVLRVVFSNVICQIRDISGIRVIQHSWQSTCFFSAFFHYHQCENSKIANIYFSL